MIVLDWILRVYGAITIIMILFIVVLPRLLRLLIRVNHWLMDRFRCYKMTRNIMVVPFMILRIRMMNEDRLRMARSIWYESLFNEIELFSFKVTTMYYDYRVKKINKSNK